MNERKNEVMDIIKVLTDVASKTDVKVNAEIGSYVAELMDLDGRSERSKELKQYREEIRRIVSRQPDLISEVALSNTQKLVFDLYMEMKNKYDEFSFYTNVTYQRGTGLTTALKALSQFDDVLVVTWYSLKSLWEFRGIGNKKIVFIDDMSKESSDEAVHILNSYRYKKIIRFTAQPVKI